MSMFRGLLTNSIEDAKIIIVGIPYDLGCSCGKGAAFAPKKIKELSSYLPPFTMDGVSLEGAKVFVANDLSIKENFYEALEKDAKKYFSYDGFPIFLGGDHSISISLEKVFLEKAKLENKIPVIIHIDAHPDICDVYDGTKFSHACPNMRALDNGYEAKNITLIGIRGYEKSEVEFLKSHPELKVFNASFINEEGFEKVYQDLKSRFSDPMYSIYLSYDIDANDPSFAPGTGTPEAFGLNSYSLMKFIKKVVKNLPVKALDIVEVSPSLDNNDITSWLALKTMYEIFEVLKEK